MAVELKDLQGDLGGFTDATIEPDKSYYAAIDKFDTENLGIQLTDNTWRVAARKYFAWCFLGLLGVQNIIVYGLVIWAFVTGRLEDLSTVIGTIVTGTLVETYLVIRIIVEWIFQDINYAMHGKDRVRGTTTAPKK